jgi:hypothetical protein
LLAHQPHQATAARSRLPTSPAHPPPACQHDALRPSSAPPPPRARPSPTIARHPARLLSHAPASADHPALLC